MLSSTTSGITPGRRTIVTLDPVDVFVLEKGIFVEKTMTEIANPDENNQHTKTPTGTLATPGYNVEFQAGHGWVLNSQVEAGEAGMETSGFDDSDIAVSVAGSIFARPIYRAATDLPGVTLASGQRASGYNVYQREVAAGGTFNDELTADKSSFPPATMTNEEIQPLLRIAVSDAPLNPTDQIIYQFRVPDMDILGERGALARVYFTGPAGNLQSDGTAQGMGQYHVTLLGTGRAILHERTDTGSGYAWVKRAEFKWHGSGRVSGHYQHLLIYSNSIQNADGTYTGSEIIFKSADMGGGRTVGDVMEAFRSLAEYTLKSPEFHYYVPNPTKYQPQPEKLRIDDRIDVRSLWKVNRKRYYRSGSIKTFTFDVVSQPSDVAPIFIEWFGNKASGTTINIRCFDAETGTELTALGASSEWTDYGYKGFDPTSGQTSDTTTKRYTRSKFYAVFELGSATGAKTPVLRRMRATRAPVITNNASGGTILSVVQKVSVSGQDSDATHETAMIQVSDIKDEHATLRLRSGVPIRIEVAYDPEDDTKKSTIFSGYVTQASKQTKGAATGAEFPADRWSTYTIRCAGEWQRLMESKVGRGICFDADPSTTDSRQAWPITEAIKYLLRDAGYEDDNIIIPTSAIRFFNSGDDNKSLFIEAMTETYPLIATFAFQYLGGWIEWDANASRSASPTKMGAWRLHLPPKPNASGVYKYLAHFKYKPSLVDGMTLSHSLNAQKSDTGLSSQPIKNVWVRKGTLASYVVPPEGNAVYVTGVGKPPDGVLSKGNGDVLLPSVIYNYNAAKFFDNQPSGPNPTHPDYTNGRPNWIYYSDPTLKTQAAVNFLARRIYDVACHAQKRISFEAPLLLVTDVTDTFQRRPRPLRYGDPVLFEGEKFFVSSVSIDYSEGGSKSMMAVYELFQPSSIGSWADGVLEDIRTIGAFF